MKSARQLFENIHENGIVNLKTGKPIKSKEISIDSLVGKVFRSKRVMYKMLLKSDVKPTTIKIGFVGSDWANNQHAIELVRNYGDIILQSVWVKVESGRIKDSIGRNCNIETIIKIVKP